MTAGVDHEYEDVYSNKIAAVLFDLETPRVLTASRPASASSHGSARSRRGTA